MSYDELQLEELSELLTLIKYEDKEALEKFNQEYNIEDLIQDAEQGNLYMQIALGDIYDLTFDYENAFKWYSRAAAQDDHEALYNLGIYYQFEYVEVEDYQTKALECYQASANLGNFYAKIAVAKLYRDGFGVKKNDKQALLLLEQLSQEVFDSTGMWLLGNVFATGEFGVVNMKKAISLYEGAAQLGDVDAMVNLGYIYYEGDGVKPNIQKSIDNFSIAAREGNVIAMTILGKIYIEGKDIPIDEGKGVSYLIQAAERGWIYAMMNLGYHYHMLGNFAECYKWYTMAQNHEDPYYSDVAHKAKKEMNRIKKENKKEE